MCVLRILPPRVRPLSLTPRMAFYPMDADVPRSRDIATRYVMIEKSLDCLGEACPVPLIRTQKALSDLAVGDVLVVQIDHSCAMKNVPEWAAKAGHNLQVVEVDHGRWEIVIEKAH